MIDRRQLMGASLVLAGIPSQTIANYGQPDDSNSLLTRLKHDLEQHAAFGDKGAGGSGDISTANWISKRLISSGFTVDRPDFDLPHFEKSAAILSVGRKVIQLLPQPVVVPTAADGITAQGLLVRNPNDARHALGRIVFLVLPYAKHAAIFSAQITPLLEAVKAAGATAILVVPTGPTQEIVGLNTRLAPMADVPIAIMAPRDLAVVSQAIEENTSINMLVSGRSTRRRSVNLLATRRAGPEWLVISTPRTGWFSCVAERGTGTAAFLELCNWAAKRFPELSIFAINSGGHEFDFIGMHKAMPLAPPPDKTRLWAHIGAGLATRDSLDIASRQDIAGKKNFHMLPSPDPQRALMVSENLREVAQRAFKGLIGLESPIPPLEGAGELSGILDHGYDNAFAVLGVHRWFHTIDDDLDKVDARLLLPVVQAHKALIEAAITQAGSFK